MNVLQKRGMDGAYEFPVAGRMDPPRTSGLTMVIDMGSGIAETRDLLDYAGRYIDILKISSGTAALYSEAVLRRKVELIRSYGIEVEAGGSHYEIANWKGKRT
ncbi:MAG: phosphosulfolactate synthase, partial [Spirochaetia bacterium]|nr:phosphosulfolactate synthase [Spirochaetia bacterium]